MSFIVIAVEFVVCNGFLFGFVVVVIDELVVFADEPPPDVLRFVFEPGNVVFFAKSANIASIVADVLKLSKVIDSSLSCFFEFRGNS